MKFLALLSLLLLTSLRPPILGHSHEVDSANKIRCIERERKALLKFKDELVDTHGRISTWGDEEHKRDCCKWNGVHCDNQTNHLTRLDIHNSGATYAPLKGNISTSLLELQHLRYLDLSYNDFDSAPIPKFIGSLNKLRYLNLSRANFGGPIPRHLGNLSKLQYLDLGNRNCYSESLDWVSNLYSLEYLDLSFTNLSLATNWPQAISKLTSMKELHLKWSYLPEIPPSLLSSINSSTHLAILDLSFNFYLNSPLALLHWFSNYSNRLTSIDLSMNKMQGPIPHVFETMVSLKHLDLSFSHLQGGIPKFFGNMSSLVHLDLKGNNLTGEFSQLVMNLSGTIEEKLEYLDLSYNSISGLFCNMSMLSSLRELKLGGNLLNGSIIEGYVQLPYLLVLYLSSNQLTGPVPDLSYSSSLKSLVLDNNMFNETLPQSFRGLSNLEVLWIGSNLFKDLITEAYMFNLSQLRILDLSLNSFLTVKFNPHWVPPFQLEYLSLRNCKVGPDFPLWLKTQTKIVYIDISNVGISDIIPSWFGSIAPELLYMNASNNQMYGSFPNFSFSTIPSFRGSLLFVSGIILDLSRNKISSSVTFLCHTKVWELIDLSDNLFFDQIPDCFANFERLRYLNLANNHFSGTMPHSFGSLSALSLLHLRNNNFSGELPTSMRNCTKLSMIDLGENKLTGKIPAWIGNSSPQLQVLILRSNEFYGNIPSNLCSLAHIQILDLSSNNISGGIPECVDDWTAMTKNSYDRYFDSLPILTILEFPIDDNSLTREANSLASAYFMWKGKEVKYMNHLGLVKLIDLSSNTLSGEIPSEITKLVNLVGLNFSRNNLTGSIPPNIGQLKSLNFLDFSINQLSGSIPTSLGELSFLGVLNLSYNNLSGRIPLDNKMSTFDELSYMGNPNLCGLPLNKSCPGDESRQDSSSGNNVLNKEDTKDDEFISEGFYIALVLGFIVGFWGIFGTILLNKNMQHSFVKVLKIVEDFVYVRGEITKARLLRCFQNV